MHESIKRAVEHIAKVEREIKEKAEETRNKDGFKELLEKNIVYGVEEIEVDGNIGAVDGGLLHSEMYGVDLVVARGAGVIFNYQKNRLKKYTYIPGPFPTPNYEVRVGLDEIESKAFASLFRLREELEVALKVVEDVKVLMLDGSLLPLPSDKPDGESEINQLYQEVIEKYKKLYEKCVKNNCLLLGVVKDSRSKRFVEIINEKVSISAADAIFLKHLLKENERTAVFTYSGNNKNPILSDIGNWKERVYAMYVRASKMDLPIRVEFLSSALSFNEIASLILTLSKINNKYTYPAILIEADLRAALPSEEIERIEKELMFFGARDLRRNSRPFR